MALQGKCALVVGVMNKYSIATGIAKLFVAEGANVISISKTHLSSRAVELCGFDSKTQVNVKFDACDVTKDLEISDLMRRCHAQFDGKLDILVHSIAYASRESFSPFVYDEKSGSSKGGLLHTSRNSWTEAQDASAYSLIALTRAAFPLFVAEPSKDKSIVALTFAGARKIVSNYNMMGVAKASLEACARQLAAELGPQQIRVNCLSSGPVKTVSARGIPGISDMRQHVLESSLLRKNVEADHIADAALFLASDKASCITGQTIYGRHSHSVHVSVGLPICYVQWTVA